MPIFFIVLVWRNC